MTCRRWIIVLFLVPFLGAGLGAAEKEIKRVFPVGPGCALLVDTNRGAILIEESEVNEVSIALTIDAAAASEAAAEKLLENVQVDFGQRDNRVTVVVRNPREAGFHFSWSEDDRADLAFRITVPRQCAVDIKAINSSVVVGNLIGRMNARVENGSVFFRRIAGSVNVRMDYGDVVVSRCSGAVSARVLRGQMRLGTIGGPVKLTNATGDIEVMAVRHSIVAETQVGEIRVGFAPGLTADSRLRVSGGNIVAAFHSKTACRLDATTTWGRVHSSLPLTVDSGASGQRSLAGRLNGGGPRISLRASGGTVTLEHGLLLMDEER